MASGGAFLLNDMVDAWEFELDHREAIVSFREERVLQLEQRLLEHQEIERVYRQRFTATKPSKPRRQSLAECGRRRSELRHKRRRWTPSEHCTVLKTPSAAKHSARRAAFWRHPASKAQPVHTWLWHAWPKVVRRMDALQS